MTGMVIGHPINCSRSDLVDEAMFHVFYNDNPGMGQHYLRIQVGYDENHNLLGHWFEYWTPNGGTFATSTDPRALISTMPKHTQAQARDDTEEMLRDDYPDFLAGLKMGDGDF